MYRLKNCLSQHCLWPPQAVGWAREDSLFPISSTVFPIRLFKAGQSIWATCATAYKSRGVRLFASSGNRSDFTRVVNCKAIGLNMSFGHKAVKVAAVLSKTSGHIRYLRFLNPSDACRCTLFFRQETYLLHRLQSSLLLVCILPPFWLWTLLPMMIFVIQRFVNDWVEYCMSILYDFLLKTKRNPLNQGGQQITRELSRCPTTEPNLEPIQRIFRFWQEWLKSMP